MKAVKATIPSYKAYIPEDKFNNNKDKFSKKSKEYGMEYVPVNMHGRPVPQGKSDENAKAVIESINKQMGNC